MIGCTSLYSMNNKAHAFLASFYFLVCAYLPYLDAQVIEIAHFQEMIPHASAETLIIFDIDDTLLIPAQMLGCDEWFSTQMQSHINEGMTAQDALEKSLAEWEAVRHLTQMELVEEGIDRVVQELQQNGYPAIGLTTQGLALATRTVQHLHKHNLDLTVTSPLKADHYFLIRGHGVLFRNGILFTAGTHKGEAFLKWLKASGFTPKKIIFVNDKELPLRELEEAAQQLQIEYVGLRYTYCDQKKITFRKEIADYQFSHSTFTHILSDREAELQLLLLQKL